MFSEPLNLSNTTSWDGKDSAGNVVPEGEFSAELEIKPGEMHIVLDDFEWLQNGIIFERLNGDQNDRYKIHYNHSTATIDGYSNGMDYIVKVDPEITEGDSQTPYLLEPLEYRNGWMTGVNSGTRYLEGRFDNSAGTDSSQGVSATEIWYPNHKSLDFWAYDDSYEKIVVAVKINSNRTIKVSKNWEDNNDQWQLRPASVIFDAFPGDSTSSSGSCTTDSSNHWECTISELPVLDGSGNEITYNIVERIVPGGYENTSAVISDRNIDNAEITNTLILKNIEVIKVWEGDLCR